MDVGLFVTFAGIVVAGLAGVLGVWMERDRSAPTRWAWMFSVLILMATCVEGGRSGVASAQEAITDEQMARVLGQLAMISEKSDDPSLRAFVDSELAAQARANPTVMKKVEKKVGAAGGDAKGLRKKAAAGRRSAAGLPPRGRPAAGKAGKAGRAGRSGTGTKTGKAGKAAGGAKAGGQGGAARTDEGGGKAKGGGKGGGKKGESDKKTDGGGKKGKKAPAL